jgi:teichuronic acid biosynthesis glycosyltransferase TuaH
MLKNEKIVCVSNSTWHGPYTKSTIQLMSLLAKDNEVLFVEYPYTIKDLIYGLTGKLSIPAARLLGIKNRVQKETTTFQSSIFTYVIPPIIPFYIFSQDWFYSFLLKINTGIYRRSIKKILRKLNWKNPIVINAYNPIFGETLKGAFDEKVLIYYCYDGFLTDRRGIRAFQSDQTFSSLADGIIVSSDYLREQKLQYNQRVASVKNGVDFDLFSRFAKNVPANSGSEKKIGYIGSIDQRFDIEIVEYVVDRLAHYNFEFVGEVRNQQVKDVLSKYPNVTFIPPVKPSDVPELLHCCDAGIIPYICDEINKNVYPLKINEYLAVGLPVIITDFARLSDFEGYVKVAKSKEEFLEYLVHELGTDNVSKIQARIRFACENSWQARAMQFSQTIEDFMNSSQLNNNP